MKNWQDERIDVIHITATSMTKRFSIGPLGQHDDDWLVIWAWCNGRSKSAQATMVLAARIREQKEKVVEMLEWTAQRRGITVDELIQQILDGEADPVEDM